ncbi:MAG: hypothetical protein WAT23_20240 [Chromatiaceae bacterium]
MLKKLNITAVIGTAAGLALGLGQAASAADALGHLVQVRGTTILSQGPRYIAGSAGMPLRAGDRLMALEGGEALLQFADTCQYRLGDDRILDVGTESPCALGSGGEYRPELRDAAPLPPVADQPPTEPERLREAALRVESDDTRLGPGKGAGTRKRTGAGAGAGAGADMGGLSLTATTALAVAGMGALGAVAAGNRKDRGDEPEPLSQ